MVLFKSSKRRILHVTGTAKCLWSVVTMENIQQQTKWSQVKSRQIKSRRAKREKNKMEMKTSIYHILPVCVCVRVCV